MPKKKQKELPKKKDIKKSIRFFTMVFLVLLSFIMTFLFYPQLPAQMASPWGLSGEANGFMPKETSAYLLPALTAIIAVALYFIPKLDPLQKNIEKFSEHYELFMINFITFFLFLQALILLWNLGVLVDFNQAIALALAILFFSIGNLISHAKKNYFIGIRTPWTLHSEEVWDNTHAFGGKAFKLSAGIIAIGALLPQFAFFFIFFPIMISAIATVAYSYFDYKKTTKR
ncbi:MAG: SdpI family protein [archaeon]